MRLPGPQRGVHRRRLCDRRHQPRPAANAEFAQRNDLAFPLLSDPDDEVALRYGAWGTKKQYGREYEGLIRSTFALVPDGALEH